ncbi:MAG: ABC transporter permease [Thermoanaerobaculia bacterium]|nr:ABC transporter permease [Thermoanaerobaculia bacterium]
MNPLSPARAFVVRAGELAQLTAHIARAFVRHPWEWREWFRQAELIGVRSLGVASITTVFTGMVLALQTAYSLPDIGVKYYIGAVVSKSLVRELGPVLVALIVGGRVGAGMTAELGTMKVTEQIDAMRSMAADPVAKLVVPKMAATLVMLPTLAVLGNVLGILGGLFIAATQLNISGSFYLNDVLTTLTFNDVISCLGKSLAFAYFIALVGCYNGLRVTGGADGVGRATTDTVVQASILILVSDFFLTKLFILIA